MTWKFITAATLAIPLAAAPVFAQDGEGPIVMDQGSDELRGDWIIGANITTPDDEPIGAIEDIIVDQEEGEVTAAIVSVGGFLGFGAKQIAVEWSRLSIDYDANVVELDITREEAEDAEEYAFRSRESEPVPEPATGTGTGTGTGMGTSTGTGTGGGSGMAN